MRLAMAGLFVVGHAPDLSAQARLTGIVRDGASGLPLPGVEVTVDSPRAVARTDTAGRYLLAGVPSGRRWLGARMLGYHPVLHSVDLIVGGTTTLDIVLERAPAMLDTIATVEDGVLPSFEEHRRIGIGRFITRAELARQEQRRLADILTELPGLAVVSGIGNRAWIAGTRRPPSLRQRCSEREGSSPLDSRRVAEGQAKDCACFVQVYLDNAILYRGPGDLVPDINRFSPAGIEAVEFYASPAQVPMKYARLNSDCGVLVIHTRRSP